MAHRQPVTGVEGYRSRDRDGVVFITPAAAPDPDTSRMVRIIDAEQLVAVGDVDLDAHERRPDGPGEWGRIGPEQRPRRRVPTAEDRFGQRHQR